MKLEKIRIVLVGPTHPGNIGSSCRAMKNMGITSLYLVTPNLSPYNIAHDMAAGADDILKNAIITNSLAEALNGCQLVFATSARARDLSLPGFTPRKFADYICQYGDDTNVAIMFGREHAGLTNDELLQAQYHINIPSNQQFSSLNLSQAVQIICYELRMHVLSPMINVQTKENPLACHEELQNFYLHLEQVLEKIEFLKPENHKRIIQKLKRLFNRTKLENIEINILRGILTQIENSVKYE